MYFRDVTDPAIPGQSAPVRNGVVAVVYNPVKGDVRRMRAAISSYAARSGFEEPLWLETSVADPGTGQARAAVEAGAALVIASGGDGTVRYVAGSLRHTGVPLAIIPNGTGNLLARTLGVPVSNVEEAVRIAFDGVVRQIDVGLASDPEDPSGTEHPFLVIAGIGIDAAMVANTNPALKERLGWLAYVDGALRSLTASKPVRVRYRVDGRSEHVRNAHSLMVGNVGALPGNIELMPGARIDDGMLDVAVVHPKSGFGWIKVWRTVVWENHVLRRSAFGRSLITFSARYSKNVISYSRGAVIEFVADELRAAELDGDPFGETRRAVLRADPGSLLVKAKA